MIILPAPPKPPESPPGRRLRILRVITVDQTGDEAWWDPDDLRRQHPELFGR